MRKLMLVTFATALTFCSLFLFGFNQTAVARTLDTANPRVASAPTTITGTRAELVGYAMPTLLQRAGYDVQVADPRLALSLQKMFNGSTSFQWAQTVVKVATSRLAFSVTLPEDAALLEKGVVVLGVIEKGTLARAFRLQMNVDQSGAFQVTLTRPNGKLATSVRIPTSRNGDLVVNRGQLKTLATTLTPSENGVFDPIIEILQQILNILYMFRDIINMAICAVDEAIDLMNDLNACGWDNIQPGGGRIVDLVVCTVKDVIEFINDLMGRCF
jgi:hypothetical protein